MEITIFVIDHTTAKVATALICSDWDIKEDAVSVAKSTFKFPKEKISDSLLESISENDFIYINKSLLPNTPFENNGFFQKIESFQEDGKSFTIKTKSLLCILNQSVIPMTDVEDCTWKEYFDYLIEDNYLQKSKFGDPPCFYKSYISFDDNDSGITYSSYFQVEVKKSTNLNQLIRKSFEYIEGNQKIVTGKLNPDSEETVSGGVVIQNRDINTLPVLEINLEDDFIDTPSITISESTAINYVVLMPSDQNAYYTRTYYYSAVTDGMMPNINITTYADGDYDKTLENPLQKKIESIIEKEEATQQISFKINLGLFNFNDLFLGRKSKLYWKGREINSRVTAFQFTQDMNKCKVTFGYTRNSLTDKLQLVDTKVRKS